MTTREQLVPDEDWVEGDPSYDTPCPVCRALIDPDDGGRAVHRAFHLAMVERADRYSPEPRYG